MSKEISNQQVVEQVVARVVPEVVSQLRAYFEPNFKSIDERFNTVDMRFNEVLEATEERFSKIDQRFDRVDISLVRLDERLEKVENRLTKVEGGVHELYTLVDGAMTKAKKVEEEQVSHLAWFRRYDAHLEKVDVDVKKLKLKTKAS